MASQPKQEGSSCWGEKKALLMAINMSGRKLEAAESLAFLDRLPARLPLSCFRNRPSLGYTQGKALGPDTAAAALCSCLDLQGHAGLRWVLGTGC